MPGVWELNCARHFWEGMQPNHYDGRLLTDFRRIKPTFEMLCNEMNPLVKLSNHIHCWGKVTWVFGCASMDLYGKRVFIVVYAHVFLLDTKIPSNLF